jgi:hypothetical protein
LSDRYELSQVEVAGRQDVLVGASTGENQILSLSFIGSVIENDDRCYTSSPVSNLTSENQQLLLH